MCADASPGLLARRVWHTVAQQRETHMTTIQLFRDARDTVVFPAGQTIFVEGQPGDCLYVVIEGDVAITHNGKLIRTVEAGSIFGEMALIEHGPRSATAIARTACKLVPVNERRFTFPVQQTPFFALQVMRIMSERLRQQDPPTPAAS
jgi:CRP-like cAMP-binding protein